MQGVYQSSSADRRITALGQPFVRDLNNKPAILDCAAHSMQVTGDHLEWIPAVFVQRTVRAKGVIE